MISSSMTLKNPPCAVPGYPLTPCPRSSKPTSCKNGFAGVSPPLRVSGVGFSLRTNTTQARTVSLVLSVSLTSADSRDAVVLRSGIWRLTTAESSLCVNTRLRSYASGIRGGYENELNGTYMTLAHHGIALKWANGSSTGWPYFDF
jgi:hypothetical protein